MIGMTLGELMGGDEADSGFVTREQSPKHVYYRAIDAVAEVFEIWDPEMPRSVREKRAQVLVCHLIGAGVIGKASDAAPSPEAQK